ncbi:hypothetical protein ACLB2K_050333 [Fragaria x ananassa]
MAQSTGGLTERQSGSGVGSTSVDMFSVIAEDVEAAKDILDGSPWSIMRYSVHFQEWPESLAIEELQSNQIAF